MEYIRLTIALHHSFHELLIAELFDMDFDGFEEINEETLSASIPDREFNDSKRSEIERILIKYQNQSRILTEEVIQAQNWNHNWEQSIEPQNIGKFYIRPTWGSKSGNKHHIELIIDPKMAFGTGYHATTRLILECLPEIIKNEDTVLDAGTGTGILAIAALKLGASSAFGFDIDEWSEENAKENMLLNDIDHLEVKLGSIETIPKDRKFDVILANINRNTLLELVPKLENHLKKGGKMLLSGLLFDDEEKMLQVAHKQSLRHVFTRQQQEWIAILLNK